MYQRLYFSEAQLLQSCDTIHVCQLLLKKLKAGVVAIYFQEHHLLYQTTHSFLNINSLHSCFLTCVFLNFSFSRSFILCSFSGWSFLWGNLANGILYAINFICFSQSYHVLMIWRCCLMKDPGDMQGLLQPNDAMQVLFRQQKEEASVQF